MLPLARKSVSTSKNMFCLSKLVSIHSSDGFRQKKKLSSKVTVSIREKNISSIAGMKDSPENRFPLNRKKSFLQQKSLKIYIYENGLYQPENTFQVPGMKHSLKNKFPRYGKAAFSDKKIKDNGFYKQGHVFLSNLVPNNFNNGFQHQKKSSEKKQTASIRQKIRFHQP